jgi:redox-sensitive bicupin YhaK (pirin superfamily)
MSSPAFSPVVAGEPIAIGRGFTALQFRHDRFPAGALSPFVLVDHFHMLAPTFDVHPHAGISAVTLVFEDTKGQMASQDSVGHNAVFGAGDLHWTLGGRGVLHTQLPVGDSHIHALQIFVNLPARLKQLPADSFHVPAAAMPRVEGKGFRLRVVAGSFGELTSPARTPEPVLMLDGQLDASAAPIEIPLPANWNAWILAVEGSVTVADAGLLAAGEALCQSGGPVRLTASAEAHFVLLAGPRIDEPVIQRGPFVLHSESAMAQAVADYQAGRFGTVASAHAR